MISDNPVPPVEKCSDAKGGFVCAASGVRIGASRRCDAVPDCPEASDERNCTSPLPRAPTASPAPSTSAGAECETALWCPAEKAGEVLCLRGEQLCDRLVDCPDGSDETRYCASPQSLPLFPDERG